MPLIIPNTTVTDSYQTFENDADNVRGSINVGNNPVDVLLIVGPRGQTSDVGPFYIPPALGVPLQAPIRGQFIRGIKVKNHIAGQSPSPQVSGNFHTEAEASIGMGQSFAGSIAASGAVSNVTALPTGTVVPYAGSTAPAGFVLCDGSAYNGTTSTYSALWGVLGTTYGGTGQSSFNVPDLRGRVVVMKGSHVDVDTLNDNDGVALANRRPKHNHTVGSATTGASVNSATTGISVSITAGGAGVDHPSRAADGSGGNINPAITVTDPGHTHGLTDPGHTHTVGPSGTNPVDAPAYLVLNYIIAL